MSLKELVLKIAGVIISMTIKFENFDFDILIDEKFKENVLVYDILYRTLVGTKPLRVRFNKIHGLDRVYDGSMYFVLLGLEKYDAIQNRNSGLENMMPFRIGLDI